MWILAVCLWGEQLAGIWFLLYRLPVNLRMNANNS